MATKREILADLRREFEPAPQVVFVETGTPSLLQILLGRVIQLGRFRDLFNIGPREEANTITEADARMGVTERVTLRRADFIPTPPPAPETPKQLTPSGLPEGMVTFSDAAQLLGIKTEDIFNLVQTGRLRPVPREELRGVSVFIRMSGVLRRADLMGLGPLQNTQA